MRYIMNEFLLRNENVKLAKSFLKYGRNCKNCFRLNANYYDSLKESGEVPMSCVMRDMPEEKICGYWIPIECITYQKRAR